jgi:hypothetical protein
MTGEVADQSKGLRDLLAASPTVSSEPALLEALVKVLSKSLATVNFTPLKPWLVNFTPLPTPLSAIQPELPLSIPESSFSTSSLSIPSHHP